MSSAAHARGDEEEDGAAPAERYEWLLESPPSVKLVYWVLDQEGTLSQDRLADATLLPDRTIRYALNRLEEADVVDATIDLTDPRRRVYSLKQVEEPE